MHSSGHRCGRLWRHLGKHPLPVHRVGDTPTASDLFRRRRRRQVALAPFDAALYPLGKLRPSHRYELVGHALTVGGDHAVDVNQVEKALGTDFGNAGYDHPGVGVAHQYDVIQRLILQELGDVADMQVEIQLRRIRAFRPGEPARPARSGWGVYTEAPDSRSNGVILVQHQPPCQAPCTSTKVAKIHLPEDVWCINGFELGLALAAGLRSATPVRLRIRPSFAVIVICWRKACRSVQRIRIR